jgi:hypothetical protein
MADFACRKIGLPATRPIIPPSQYSNIPDAEGEKRHVVDWVDLSEE